MNSDDRSNSNSASRPGRARPWRVAGLVAALAVTALLAAACGGVGSSGSSSDENTTAQLDAFASCVRSHGVPDFYFTTSTPSPPPYGAVIGFGHYNAVFGSTAAFDAAAKKCQHLAPSFKFSGPPRASHQQFLRELKSAECMRSHGYPNWPDPRHGRLGLFMPGNVDTSSPQFKAAVKKCGQP